MLVTIKKPELPAYVRYYLHYFVFFTWVSTICQLIIISIDRHGLSGSEF